LFEKDNDSSSGTEEIFILKEEDMRENKSHIDVF
jgi:hypothetical protein